MKKIIFTVSVLIMSVPMMAQTSFSGASAPINTPISSVTGAPILDPSNTSAVPPTLDRGSPVNNTGAETAGTGSGAFGTTNTGTNVGTGTNFGSGTNFGTGTGSATGTGTQTGTTFGTPSSTPTQAFPPATGTTQPSGSIMNPSGTNAPTGSGWQGR